MSIGGQLGHDVSAETRAKISAALKGRGFGHAGGSASSSGRSRTGARGSATGVRRPGLHGVRRPHQVHGSRFARISTGAGYHHHYTGRLRAQRKSVSSGRLRFTRTQTGHRAKARRR